VPTLVRLSRTAKIGRRTVKAALPVADRLKGVARELPENVRMTTALVESLRDTGGVEYLLSFLYYATASSARFDSISHLLPAFLVGNNCFRYSTVDTADCEDNLGGAGAPAARKRRRGKADVRRQTSDVRPRDRGDRPTPLAPQPRAPSPSPPRSPVPLPDLPVPAEPGGGQVEDLLDWLLGP
jgi:phospholipid/cholesterol/gamma-HCH transport system substrate-binding protein